MINFSGCFTIGQLYGGVMEIKDGYLEFFDSFNIDKKKLIKFGLDKAIFCGPVKAQSEWNKLKNAISSKQITYIRGYGRDAKGTILFQHLYEILFDIPQSNIKKDTNNNAVPTKLIQEWTGFFKNGTNKNIQNYQVSHIFGKTKNPYLFSAPFNIMFLPKILDPFTGHESKGEFSIEFKKEIQGLAYRNFSALIEEYNKIVLKKQFGEGLAEAVEHIASSKNYINQGFNMGKFKTDAIAEFRPISIST